MAIIRTTPTIGISIMERGTTGWGTITNNNLDLVDSAIALDRTRILSLESLSAILPVAIAGRVGHNILDNNIFSRPVTSDPAQAVAWTVAFANGANGYNTRDTSTYLVGTGGSQAAASMRISITNVNLSGQTRPYPGLNILDPSSNEVLATNDPRQLTNAFGYIYQSAIMAPKTRYTLSAYGKSEIPTSVPPINVHWKIGIVFKDTSGNILLSYFTQPQMNYTSDKATSSFQRAELSFITPDLPQVLAEVWLVNAGNAPGSIGSSFFDGVQLEQASRATFLEAFAVRNGDLSVAGDLTVGGSLKLQQDQLVLATNKVIFSGNVQIGDDINEDVLDVFTKISTFYGPVAVKGSMFIGDDPINDLLKVTVNKTTFFNNQDSLAPQGGDVEIQGALVVKGDVVLGDNPTQDTVTINATLTTASTNLSTGGDLSVGGSLTVAHAVELGTNRLVDGLVINMTGLGVDINGDTRLHNDLSVDGNVTIGNSATDIFHVQSGAAIFDGSVGIGKALTVGSPYGTGGAVNINTATGDFNLVTNDINITAPTGETTWNSSLFNLSGSLEVGSGQLGQYLHALVSDVVLGDTAFAQTGALAAYALYSTFSGNMAVHRDLDSWGALNVGGGIFNSAGTLLQDVDGYIGSMVFGTKLLTSGRSFVAFNPQVITPNTGPSSGLKALGGIIKLGDDQALKVDGYGRTKYQTDIYVNAGTTRFGTAGAGLGGDEVVGDVIIGGNLTVGGTVALGNDIATDQIDIKAQAISFAVGSGNFDIGGPFLDLSWTPANYLAPATVDGGITMDNKGNLSMDGKLTVKGPIDPIELILTPLTNVVQQNAISIQPGGTGPYTFRVLKSGNLSTEGTVTVVGGDTAFISPTAVTLGSVVSPLTTLTVTSTSSAFSGALSAGSVTTANLSTTNNTTVGNDLTVSGDVDVSGNLTVDGSTITLGSGSALVDVLATQTTFGNYLLGTGSARVAQNLTVRHSVTMGEGYGDLGTLNFDTINIYTQSDRLNLGGGKFVELKGTRFGGGYQNNVFANADLDHGGVTIDGYGNIFADGSIVSNGSLGFNSIVVTAPLGTPNCDFLIRAENKNLVDDVFRLDNLGNVEADGYYYIHDKYRNLTCFPTMSQTYPYDGYAMFKVLHDAVVNDTVFEVDNKGNVVVDGYLTTLLPSGSNLATVSVTVGDGTKSFGDYNLVGHLNASTNPIQAAINYLTSHSLKGTVFVKKGTYPLLSGGLTVGSGISVIGEGTGTILSGLTNSTTTGMTLADDAACKNLLVTNCTTGISVNAGAANVTIANAYINQCTTGIVVNTTATDVHLSELNLQQCATGITTGTSSNRVSLRKIFMTHTSGTNGVVLAGSNQSVMDVIANNYGTTFQSSGNDNTFDRCRGIATANAFTLSGARNVVQYCNISGGTGRSVSGTATSVVISNNTFTTFSLGMQFTSGTATNNTVSGISTAGTVSLVATGQATVTGNTFTGYAQGFQLATCSVSSNNVTGTGAAASISLVATGPATIANNTFSSYAQGFQLTSGTATNNTVSGISTAGTVSLVATGQATVTGNTFTGYAQGFQLTTGSILNNSVTGLGSASTTAITLSGTSAFVSGNIFDSFAAGLTASGARNKIVDNTFTLGTTNGIVLAAGATDAIVAENYLSGFATIGISAAGTRTSISNNVVTGAGSGTALTITAGSIVISNNNCQNYGIGLSLSGSKIKATSNIFGASATSTTGIQFLTGSDGSMVIGNQFDDFDSRGATIASGVQDCVLSSNKFANTTGPIAIVIELVGSNVANVIAENIIRNADQGIVITGSGNRVMGNTIIGTNTVNTGIAVGGSDQLIEGNFVQSFASNAISLSATTSQVVNNELLNGATCINVLLGQNIIANNNLRSYTTTGISIPTGVTGCIVNGNRVTGGAAAATGINVVGDENAINSNYVVDHTTNGIVISGSNCTAIGNITLRNP